ncbi:hypothetical protein ACO0K9_26445 [Undibacterium sp. Ji50W]|uniref:hypothetical protein n=1 Tax=Undibacterium sp. Ji50W TaxID=3413041 RepID=UPI003BF26DC2
MKIVDVPELLAVALYPLRALAQSLQLVLDVKARVPDQIQAQIAASRADVLDVPLVGDFEDERLMAEDEYHPSALGVSFWARELAKIIIENPHEK